MALTEEDKQKLSDLLGEMPQILGSAAEMLAFKSASKVMLQGIQENSIAAAGAVVEVQKAVVEASKALGADFNKQLNLSIKLFKELSDQEKLGISLENIEAATNTIGQTFKNTAFETDDALTAMSTATARYANVLDKSQMANYIKTFAFQTGLGAKGAATFAGKMIDLSDSMGRPPGQLIKLSSELINTNIAFGSTDAAIARLALRTDKFAQSLGISSDKVKGLLGGMMTIGERQQTATRLSQIGGVIAQQTGQAIDIDIQGLMSPDPNRQLTAIKTTLKSLSGATRNVAGPQLRDLSLALTRVPSIGRQLGFQGIQAALADPTRIDELADAARARRGQVDAAAETATGFAGFFNRKGGMSSARVREFATIQARVNEAFAAKRLALGVQQVEAIAKAFDIKQTDIVGLARVSDQKMMDILQATSDFAKDAVSQLTSILLAYIQAMSAEGSNKVLLTAQVMAKIKNIVDQQATQAARRVTSSPGNRNAAPDRAGE